MPASVSYHMLFDIPLLLTILPQAIASHIFNQPLVALLTVENSRHPDMVAYDLHHFGHSSSCPDHEHPRWPP